MTAWLDALLPPLDPTLGFWLIVAAVTGWLVSALRNRPPAPAADDPMARPHGDVPRISRDG